MPRPRPEALALAEAYTLALRLPAAQGPSGHHKGRGTGASVEFQDHRSYLAGDDVRHLDWRAYARTDQLLLKRYREEVRPTLDLVLDLSASMAADPDKAQRAVDLAALFARAGAAEGLTVRIFAMGDKQERIELDRLLGQGLDYTGVRPLDEALVGFRSGSGVVLLLSDFLFPHAPDKLVRSVRAGRLGLVQVLSGFDLDPGRGGAVRFEDSETSELVDLSLDEATLERYHGRLERLCDGLQVEARRRGGIYARVRSDLPLQGSARTLLEAGLLGL